MKAAFEIILSYCIEGLPIICRGTIMRKTVLIIEDNVTQLEMLRRLVLEVNPLAEVYTATDVNTAYAVLMDRTIDTFLVDIILDTTRPGDSSGARLVGRIRKMEKYRFTPVIFITSLEDVTKYAYTDLNCLGYVEKPFSPETVKQLVEKALYFSTQKDDNTFICFSKNGVFYPIKVYEIAYIDSMRHVVTVHLANGSTMTVPYKPCRDFLREADSDNLFQCSRSAIVNKNFVLNIDIPNGYITMRGSGDKVEIGSTYKKKVLMEFGL